MTSVHPPRASIVAGVCTCGQPYYSAAHGLEPQAVARRTDPDTSWEAARSVDHIRESQQEILALFRKFGPMTDEAARAAYTGRQSVSGFRTRRSELVAQGLIRDTGKRARGSTGRRMIVWSA